MTEAYLHPMVTPLIHMSHPYGGDANKLDAARLKLDTLRRFTEARFWAPWIDICMCLEDTPENRELGTNFDRKAVELSHGVLSFDVGENSSGCRLECATARALGIPICRLWKDAELNQQTSEAIYDLIRRATAFAGGRK